jgi:hypothetical protein
VTALARWEGAARVGASRSGLLYKMVLAPVRLGGAQKVYCVKGLVGEEWGYGLSVSVKLYSCGSRARGINTVYLFFY